MRIATILRLRDLHAYGPIPTLKYPTHMGNLGYKPIRMQMPKQPIRPKTSKPGITRGPSRLPVSRSFQKNQPWTQQIPGERRWF